jgi:hypothetical protein
MPAAVKLGHEEGARGMSNAKFNAIVICLLAAGSGLIFGPRFFMSEDWAGALSEFGVALLIAGLLALTVDKFIQRRFANEIAQDVFRVTVGYLLPSEFQDAMRWIYEQKVICDNHLQQIKIGKVDETCIKFRCRQQRHLRNVSNADFPMSIGLGADEWFGAEPSEILEFGYQIEGEKRVDVPLHGGGQRSMDKGRPVIKVPEQKITLPMGKTVIVWTCYCEFKPINSDHHSHFTWATKNPQVTIEADDGIAAIATFPRETGANKVQTMLDSYIYKGLVLPGQEIRIRWWEEEKRQTWFNASSHASSGNASHSA